MELTYIYHSGFAISGSNFSILIDYFKDTNAPAKTGYVKEKLLTSGKPLYILSSHFHPDHFNQKVLTWKEEKENIHYIFSKDILKRKRAHKEDAVYLKKGDTYQDDQLRITAFGSTDCGISFLIEAEGKKIFHAGDLNNWHWKDESTPEEIDEAEKAYLHEIKEIKKNIREVTLAMFPVDPRLGSDFMRGAEQFIDTIQTEIFVPMHFWERPAEAAAFEAYATGKGVKFCLLSTSGQQLTF
ncbi:MAG: MBL fold metallo-hydrolase [Tannerellaceae bacterium]|nr:MBL fold metallo-hydrolase [Tannerellaceae bacterium]